MKHLWSKPDFEWDGFKPVAYHLGTKRIWSLPLTSKFGDGKTDESTTVGDMLALLRETPLKAESLERGGWRNEFVATDDSLKVTVEGTSFTCGLLKILLQMYSENINPFYASWYYFDHDRCRADPQEMYSFFVVANNTIVREEIGFSDYDTSGFDPAIFEPPDYANEAWWGRVSWDDANTRYWYRKFYTETRTGQLMVLRPDKPQLYHYEHGGSDVIRAIGVLNQSLSRTRLVLWILVALAILGLIVIRWK